MAMEVAAAPRSSNMDIFIMAAGELRDKGERPVSSQSLHTRWRLENKESVLEVDLCTYIPFSTSLPLVIPSSLLFSSDLIIVSPCSWEGKDPTLQRKNEPQAQKTSNEQPHRASECTG